MCNLKNTHLQNISKISTHSNLKIRLTFDLENKTKNNPKHLLCNYYIFLGDFIILHNLQNTNLQTKSKNPVTSNLQVKACFNQQENASKIIQIII